MNVTGEVTQMAPQNFVRLSDAVSAGPLLMSMSVHERSSLLSSFLISYVD